MNRSNTNTGRVGITISSGATEQEPLKRPLSWGLIRRLFSYTKPYRRTRNILLGIVLLRAVQLPLLAWWIGAVINLTAGSRDFVAVVWGAVGFVVLSAFNQFIFGERIRLALILGERVMNDLRQAVYRHLFRMPMEWFQRMKLGRIISRMTSDIESVRAGIQEVFFISAVQLGQMVVAAVLMLACDPVLFFVVLGLAPGLVWINRHFTARLGEAYRRMQESFSRVTATVAESIGGIRVTQSFVRERVNAGIFRQLLEDHSRLNMGAARMNALLLPLLDLNSQFFTGMLLLIGGLRVLTPGAGGELGDLVQFFFLAGMFFQPIQVLGNQYNMALTAMAGAERVFRLLDTPPAWEDCKEATPLTNPAGRVDFKQVTFGYEPRRLVLHEVSFAAEPGSMTALVGHTGSGKSSILNLITRLYLPNSGRILVDGHDLTRVSAPSLHRAIGLVQQTNFLFSGTVLDNLRIGNPDATEVDARAAADAIGCLDIVENLPEGFLTVVGERGSGLSLGQRQIVCFVRAVLANPRILLLDEATSSIDSITEHRIQRALEALLRNRTSIVVAHRLSTVRRADTILVLESGRIVERGTHDALVAGNGVYATLHAQFDAGAT